MVPSIERKDGIQDINISAGLHEAPPSNHRILHYFAVLDWTGSGYRLLWTGSGYRNLHGIGLDGSGISYSVRDHGVVQSPVRSPWKISARKIPRTALQKMHEVRREYRLFDTTTMVAMVDGNCCVTGV